MTTIPAKIYSLIFEMEDPISQIDGVAKGFEGLYGTLGPDGEVGEVPIHLSGHLSSEVEKLRELWRGLAMECGIKVLDDKPRAPGETEPAKPEAKANRRSHSAPANGVDLARIKALAWEIVDYTNGAVGPLESDGSPEERLPCVLALCGHIDTHCCRIANLASGDPEEYGL